MSSVNIEEKINSFMQRKAVEFPELATSGRHESRTVKYAQGLRSTGQLMYTR